MQQKIIFGKWEGTCLLITMIGTKVVLNYPRSNAVLVGTAGWILAIYTGVLALLFFMVISKLYAPFQGKDLIDIAELAGGKFIRTIVGVIITSFLLYIVSAELRLFAEQMKAMAFTKTPIEFIILLFLIGTIFAAYQGLETIVRFQAIFVPISIGAFSLFILVLMPYWKPTGLFPLLGNGSYDLFVKGASRVSEFSELLILFLIVPYIRLYKDFKTVGWLSLLASMFFMTSLTIAYLGIFIYPTALLSILPAFDLGRIIDYGRFVEKTEAILVVTWATMAFMYLSAGFYFLLSTFSKTFNIKYTQPLIPAYAIVVFALSMIPRGVMTTSYVDKTYFRGYSWLITFAMTIVVLLLARRSLKNGKVKEEHQ